jgi:hypothetical protein
LLKLGELEPMALPGASYSLALTPGLIANVYRDKLDDAQDLLNGACGYIDLDSDGKRWIPSAGSSIRRKEMRNRVRSSAPRVATFSFRAASATRSVILRKSPMMRMTCSWWKPEIHWATCSERKTITGSPAQLVVDANGNRSEASYDALGLIAGHRADG